jgi:tol-pal system protein YbgF
MALAAAGCLTASQQSRLQTDMAEVRQQVFEMQKDTSAILSRMEGLEQSVAQQQGASPTRFADLESLIQSLADQVRTLGARLDDNTARMATLAHEIALTRQQGRALDARLAAALATRGLPPPGTLPPGSPEGAPGASAETAGNGGDEEGGAAPTTAVPLPVATAGADPGDVASQETSFRAAYADYTRGSFESALIGFQEFLKSFPGSPLAEGAQYYIGDCLFSQQRYEEASDAFTVVIERYPASDKAPSAHLKKGLSLLALRQTARGVIQLQHVIETYPRSEEARLARDRLRQLGLSVR